MKIKNKIKNYIDSLLLDEEEHFYLVLDYYNDDHAKKSLIYLVDYLYSLEAQV